ncbi:MAG: ABC transporter permease [Methylobacteriaceae bacterium]|nr:ABC transporter permease [Methylobacteriaceae bacterium]
MSAPIELPKWADAGLIPILNVAAAFIISGLVVLLIGENPLTAMQALIGGALGSPYALGYTLYYATNFIFTGLAVAVAFHAGLFNIGGEGQAYVGGLGAALVCLGFGFLPGIILIPFAILGAVAFAAAWAAVPGYLQAKRGSHIVITTIMFNWLATTLLGYLLVNVIIEPGSMNPETRAFPPASHIPKFNDLFALIGIDFPNTPLNLSFVLALLCAVGVWLLVWRTRLGYEMRTVGTNPVAAIYGGIPPPHIIIVAMAISGALAGGLAVNEVLGVQNRLLLEFTQGYGLVGIAVALMGRGHPVGIVLASVLFGMLYQGGTELAFDMPKITRDMIVVIQGLVVLFAGALEAVFKRPLAHLLARSTA